MIILDTNVISELMRPRPIAQVVAWVDARVLSDLFMTVITVMEVRLGIALLPEGRRRAELEASFTQFIGRAFEDRVLAFDHQAAEHCARARAQRRLTGSPISVEDGMIAGIARARGAAVATRDESGFEACGVAIVNPWL